jgi:uncharacterized protein DUF4287
MVTREAVRKATGRDWAEWFALLDGWGATGRPHRDIAARLAEEYGIGNWWSQTVTVAYEHARGLRPHGGSRDGTFAVTASRTMAVPVERLFAAFLDDALRARWLPDVPLLPRTVRPVRSARFEAGDGTRVNVGFTAVGPGRARVALQHERLPDAGTADKYRAHWRERLAALDPILAG